MEEEDDGDEVRSPTTSPPPQGSADADDVQPPTANSPPDVSKVNEIISVFVHLTCYSFPRLINLDFAELF